MDTKTRVYWLLYAAFGLGRKVGRGGEVTEEDLDALRLWASRIEAEGSSPGDVDGGVRMLLEDQPWLEGVTAGK